MKPDTSDTPKKQAKPAPEVANIAAEVLVPGTKIGKAICGKGRLSFPLTPSDAETLEGLGKIRIIGIY